MKMNNVRLLVENFDQCFEFYSEKMGFEVIWGKKGDVYGSFKVDESFSISIFVASLMDEHVKAISPQRHRSSDQTVLIFETDDTDAIYKKLRGNNVEFINEPHDMPGWGSRCVHLRDPEGNLLEIYTTLPKEKWAAHLLEDAKNY